MGCIRTPPAPGPCGVIRPPQPRAQLRAPCLMRDPFGLDHPNVVLFRQLPPPARPPRAVEPARERSRASCRPAASRGEQRSSTGRSRRRNSHTERFLGQCAVLSSHREARCNLFWTDVQIAPVARSEEIRCSFFCRRGVKHDRSGLDRPRLATTCLSSAAPSSTRHRSSTSRTAAATTSR